MELNFNHISVLKDEVIQALNIKPNGLYLDGTIGGGGHALEVLKRLEVGKLIGIDRDDDALRSCRERLAEFGDRLHLIKGNYKDARQLLMPYGYFGFDGILLDIGVSSYQLDNAERGFTFRENSRLDMRMDKSNPLDASRVVNEYSVERLRKIFQEYGEEKFSDRIARDIVKKREIAPINMSSELVDIILKNITRTNHKDDMKSVMRIFQAIRIEVNDELNSLSESIPGMIKLLRVGGRLAIITFHSLEDRIVKQAFQYEELDCICDKKAPICTCNKKRTGRIITRKPILPSEEELKNNSRAHSAKLRVIERI